VTSAFGKPQESRGRGAINRRGLAGHQRGSDRRTPRNRPVPYLQGFLTSIRELLSPRPPRTPGPLPDGEPIFVQRAGAAARPCPRARGRSAPRCSPIGPGFRPSCRYAHASAQATSAGGPAYRGAVDPPVARPHGREARPQNPRSGPGLRRAWPISRVSIYWVLLVPCAVSCWFCEKLRPARVRDRLLSARFGFPFSTLVFRVVRDRWKPIPPRPDDRHLPRIRPLRHAACAETSIYNQGGRCRGESIPADAKRLTPRTLSGPIWCGSE